MVEAVDVCFERIKEFLLVVEVDDERDRFGEAKKDDDEDEGVGAICDKGWSSVDSSDAIELLRTGELFMFIAGAVE